MHVGKLVDHVIRERKMIKASIAREMNMSTQNFSGLLKRESIGIDKIQQLSQIIGYDFINHIANVNKEKMIEDMVMEGPGQYQTTPKRVIPVTVELDGTPETLTYWMNKLSTINSIVN